ncbi:DUF4105 domain-containing protein [Asticcacaulis sp. YBE204]|uniref:lipoprotein N-acyltransferase Lnb domain-containing protein n=1 Tax=Asticcacaulis sp. YBE204 TaxID=1282363 RepID=UPI00190F4282|nr:DUF4105 domain-containing protein [Asticcacaulis sp. YBE204]
MTYMNLLASSHTRRILHVLATVLVVGFSLYGGLAIFYWLGWPVWLRYCGAIIFPVVVLGLWLWPKPEYLIRRGLAVGLLTILFIGYAVKTPVEQEWVPLMSRHASVAIDGDFVTITNFRDAVHRTGQPSVPVWTTESFDLSQLTGADLIIQPFGTSKATAHILLSLGFADGRHIVVSMESRQAKGRAFDAVAGFFRHDQIYPELATERDLFWERLARTPPDNLQIYPIRKRPEVLRAYLERIFAFTNNVRDTPKFYSTLDESCMTAFINLAPESFASVPFYDVRRWIPGYSLSLFQQLDLVDDSLPADELARRYSLQPNLQAPDQFSSDAAWSTYVRQHRGAL